MASRPPAPLIVLVAAMMIRVMAVMVVMVVMVMVVMMMIMKSLMSRVELTSNTIASWPPDPSPLLYWMLISFPAPGSLL